MSWWGMILGGTFGFLIGGPIGAVLGAAVGRSFGRAVKRIEADGYGAGGGRGDGYESHERVQLAFFTATFGVMGHVAKADGRVTAEEIRLANRVMEQLGLDSEHRQAARAIFEQGKSPAFPLDGVLDQLRAECGRASNLLRMFLELQLEAAWADGDVDPEERRVLRHVAARLGVGEAEYLELERMVGAGGGGARGRSAGGGAGAGGPTLEEAYATLGVSPDTPDAEVKRAYRRLMSRHHPDKLVSQGLPDEMMRAATERTQQIKAAWEKVRSARAAGRRRGARSAA